MKSSRAHNNSIRHFVTDVSDDDVLDREVVNADGLDVQAVNGQGKNYPLLGEFSTDPLIEPIVGTLIDISKIQFQLIE